MSDIGSTSGFAFKYDGELVDEKYDLVEDVLGWDNKMIPKFGKDCLGFESPILRNGVIVGPSLEIIEIVNIVAKALGVTIDTAYYKTYYGVWYNGTDHPFIDAEWENFDELQNQLDYFDY